MMSFLVSRCAALLICAALPWAAWAQKVVLATSEGEIVLELDREKAPRTVDNFIQYVRSGHYDGTIFHRVIDNFMIQGGGFDTRFAQKRTRAPIGHEGREAQAKGLRNTIGTLAMARTSDPNSATAQFFINVRDNAFLDHTAPTMQGYGYTVFGRVVGGMEVVNRIKSIPTGPAGPFPSDVPRTPVVIESATIVR
jgi:peptidyl-prolyl cis-trans isomerase A (cyclophilin A)